MSFGENKECLPHWEDEYNTRSNLFFGCLSAANGLKNAFVLVQISRFQQIIGVYTLQAPSEQAKVRPYVCSIKNHFIWYLVTTGQDQVAMVAGLLIICSHIALIYHDVATLIS